MTTPSAPEPTWLDACRAFARAHDLDETVLAALDTFRSPLPRGGPPPAPERPWSGAFEALEESLAASLDAAGLARDLAAELDGAQPGVFARRVAATEAILREQSTPRARILRVGLRVRLEGIRAAPRPRARRVRALADYYYSLAVRPEAPGDAFGASLAALVRGAGWRTLADGLEHVVLEGRPADMPTHANLLRVDPRRVSLTVANLREAALNGHDFAQAVQGRAAAAISGGFFLYSEDDIGPPSRRHDPVGLLVCGGVVHGPPVFSRAAFLVGPRGEVAVRRVGLQDVGVRLAGRAVRPGAYWNRAHAEFGPDAPSVAVVGAQVTAVGRRLRVPLNGFVATFGDDVTAGLAPGAPVRYTAPALPGGARALAGIGGGPMLVDAGRAVLDMKGEDFWGSAPPITFSQDETGDRNLLARLALGIDAEGRVVAAAVDGRNAARALGMTLADVSHLMILLGCTRAMNLDGGSSKRMLVDGRVVDLPSTEIVASASAPRRVRPVHTAILCQPLPGGA